MKAIPFLLLNLALVPLLTAAPLKVHIPAGRSNMQGHASVTTFDSMARDPAPAPLLKEMRGPDGSPAVAKRTGISCLSEDRNGNPDLREGKLTAGIGARPETIGPEFKGSVANVFTGKFLDHEPAAVRAKKAGDRSPEEQELAKGVSNQEFHHLGAAKISAPIGKAFAEAISS